MAEALKPVFGVFQNDAIGIVSALARDSIYRLHAAGSQ